MRLAATCSWTRWSDAARASSYGCRPVSSGLLRLAAVDAVERGAGLLLEGALDAIEDPLGPVEPALDGAPAGADQLDEDRKVLEALAPFGRDLGLEGFDAADHLAGEAAHLGNVPGDGQDLRAHALLDGGAEALRNDALELGRGLRERVETCLGALEGRFQVGPRRPFLAGLGDPSSGAFERVAIHRR